MGALAHSKGAHVSRVTVPPLPGLSPLSSCPWAPLTLSHCEAHHDEHAYKHVGFHYGILRRGAVSEGCPEIPLSHDHAPWSRAAG